MAYIKRAVEDTIARVSKMFPVLLVTGPRQVGKTTLLQKMAEAQQSEGIERKYVTLDDPDARYLAKHDPALFLQRYSPPVLIDEIQYATELLPYIKMSVDRSKRKGDFWITGSQVFRLMKNVSESLAGRVGIVNLLGLSDAEIYQEPSEPFQTEAGHLMERLSVKRKRDLMRSTAGYSKVLCQSSMRTKMWTGKLITAPMLIPICKGIFGIWHRLRMKCSFTIL